VSNSGSLASLGVAANSVSLASGRRLLAEIFEDIVIGQATAPSVLNSLNGRMTCRAFREFDIRFRLQVIHQTIVEGMRDFGGAIDFGKFVTRQAAPAFVIKRCGLRTVKILQVENRATQQFGEKFAFCNAVAVEVSEHCHRLTRGRVQIVVGYVIVFPIDPFSSEP